MNEKALVFGRAADSDVIITHPDVSSRHARISYLGDNMFEVEDLDSVNGTYINGYRIRKAKVSLQDQVRLSAAAVLDLAKVFHLTAPGQDAAQKNRKPNPRDYIKEFGDLKQVYTVYKEDRKKLMVSHNRKLALIRGGITIIPLVFLFTENISIMGVTTVAAAAANYFTGGLTNIDQLEELDENFRIRYVCPNTACMTQLGNLSWRVVYETGKCMRCGAIYHDKHLTTQTNV